MKLQTKVIADKIVSKIVNNIVNNIVSKGMSNMEIFEKRCKIKDITDARNVAEKIGGVYRGYYSFTDFIINPENVNKENVNKEKATIMLRVWRINNRQAKKYRLTEKIPEWSGNIKTDKTVLKEEFNTIEDTIDFMIDHYGNFHEEFEYSRDGWEYLLDKNGIFIENIEKLGPTIEIESDNKDDLENLLKSFDATECFSESTPEIMRKLLY